MLFAVPIMHKMCSYADIYRLDLYDFILMNEILQVKFENEDRARKASQNKANRN